MNRRRLLRATAAAVGGLAGCSAPRAPGPPAVDTDAWPTFRRDVRNTGCNVPAGGPSSNPTVNWSFETGDAIWGSPVCADGVVYVGSYDGRLYAIGADSGDELWTFPTADRIDGSAAVVDETVYIGSFDTNVYAVDTRSGEQRWAFPTGGIVRSSPTVVDGTVFVGSHCRSTECARYYDEEFPAIGFVYAIDAESGEQRWAYETGDEVLSSPAVDDDTVYVGSFDHHVHAIDRATGEKRWTFDAERAVFSSPAVANGVVYVASNRNVVYALDAASGDMVWEFDPNVNVLTGSPAICDDTVFIGGGGVTRPETSEHFCLLYAIDADRGTERWVADVPGEVIGASPAIADGVVYVGSNRETAGGRGDPGLFAFTTDGEVRWWYIVGESDRFHGTGGFGSSPAVVDDTLYVGSADNYVYSLS